MCTVWSWLAGLLTSDRIIALATVVYAIVTIVMFRSIRSQARAAHRQADIADLAAKAAKQSADAIISSERAWIAVRAKHNMKTSSRATALTGDPVEGVDCIIQNCGKTPARLTGIGMRHEIVKKGTELSGKPNHENMIKPMGEMLLAPGDSASRSVLVMDREIRALGNTPGYLYVYGIVHYLDAFNAKRYTGFCWSCEFPSGYDSESVSEMVFRRDGPPGYNNAT